MAFNGNNLKSASPDRERDSIKLFTKNLCPGNPVPVFEIDASAFRIGNEEFLFSTDEFSCEDNFRSHNPVALGWNVAAATMSDILAAGGVPYLFAHSVTIQYDWDDLYLDHFSKGIASCLKTADAQFLGGDLGMSDKWKYTGIAIGKKLAGLTRKGAKEGDLIYVTGRIGSGNLEAALDLYSEIKPLKPLLAMIDIRFPLRLQEAVLVRKYANCCIDSSDGLFRALLDLAGNGRVGFHVDQVPYHQQGQLACRVLGKPTEILFLGECGEYELVFTISPEREPDFLRESVENKLHFTKIGTITGEERYTYNFNGKALELTAYSIFARNFQDVHEYIREVTHFIEQCYGGPT